MAKPIKVLLQTTIPNIEDDWNISRFSMLRDYLASLKDEEGNNLFEVTARDRHSKGDEAVLLSLDQSEIDELWLFAVDTGEGLTPKECAAITRFRQRGGGILATRDHQDLGSSLCTLGGIGRAHVFHSRNIDPDQSRRISDDHYTKSITWPNYHTGRNGDYQAINVIEPVHELLRNPSSPTGVIRFFPAHPHEGDVCEPEGESNARVIATGRSLVTDRRFNLVVAFDHSTDDYANRLGRAIAESSFHHLCDYNWDTDKGCPSFVEEAPGDGYRKNPEALEDIKAYARNAALWLAAR